MIKYLYKDAFAVIGKAGQGSADSFEEWTNPLWAALESGLSEIEGIVRKNAEGKPFIWSALNDNSESNKRWGEPGFDSSGKYMAACEADVDAAAPNGWTKWIIPAQTYMVIEGTPAELESAYAAIVETHGPKIVGVGHSFFPEYGNDDLVETYIPIASGMMHCQSCGIPMTEDSHFGKNADGSTNEDYCCYCYSNGAFTSPDETMEEMIESCVPFIVEDGVHATDENSARKLLTEFLPTLKRWKKQGMIISFKLRDGVSTEDFLAASDEIQEKYLSACKGFISRQLMIIDGVWTDWVIWETMADANIAMEQSMDNESGQKFTSLVGDILEYKLYPLERSY